MILDRVFDEKGVGCKNWNLKLKDIRLIDKYLFKTEGIIGWVSTFGGFDYPKLYV